MIAKTHTLTSAARYLGVSRVTLYNWLKDGRFAVPCIPNSKPRRWNIEDLDAWRKGTTATVEPSGDGE